MGGNFIHHGDEVHFVFVCVSKGLSEDLFLINQEEEEMWRRTKNKNLTLMQTNRVKTK